MNCLVQIWRELDTYSHKTSCMTQHAKTCSPYRTDTYRQKQSNRLEESGMEARPLSIRSSHNTNEAIIRNMLPPAETYRETVDDVWVYFNAR